MSANSGFVVAFWFCALVVLYPIVIYPALLVLINRVLRRQMPLGNCAFVPAVSVVCPVHNEAKLMDARVENLLALEYPTDRCEFLIVGDGCTDQSLEIAERSGAGRVKTLALPRSGKAAALNAGVQHASGEIIVFTDAGIRLEREAIRMLTGRFADGTVGCVSGEDWLASDEAEGNYGGMEVRLRREEARLHSIAGASGCLYAIRRELWRPFEAGMAPDFLSVLDTVRAGRRAICEPAARGVMTATRSVKGEFSRKARTFLRGMTTLRANAALLNPLRYPAFSFILASHKLSRWVAPPALAGCFLSSVALRESLLYGTLLQIQAAIYLAAVAGLAIPALTRRSTIVRLSAYYVVVNAALVKAFAQLVCGVRQELWEPTRRST